MKKKLLILLCTYMMIGMTGCDSNGISQEEYDRIVSERDEYKEKYESILESYAEVGTENTINEIIADDVHEEVESEEVESEEVIEEEIKEDVEEVNETSETMGKKNALSMAKDYLDYSSFSYSGLVEQLEYEGFSHEEALYGADNCGADWNEQAKNMAKDYLDYSSFSKQGLIEQLEYEGFSNEQAVYGAEANGY